MDKLQYAQLQVVLPGSGASFRRRVIDAMRGLVSASGAFCFFGKEDARAYGAAERAGLRPRMRTGRTTKIIGIAC